MPELFREVIEGLSEHDNEEFTNLLRENLAKTGALWIEEQVLTPSVLSAYSPNRKQEICAENNYHDGGTLEIRDSFTGLVVARSNTPGVVLHVVFPGSELAVAVYRVSDSWLGILLWSGKFTFSKIALPRPNISNDLLVTPTVRLSPSANHLLVSFGTRIDSSIPLSCLSSERLFLIELGAVKTWSNPLTIGVVELSQLRTDNLRVDFSPDGYQLAIFPVVATMEPEEYPGTIMNLQDGTQRKLAVDGVTRGVTWSPCGRWIATYQEPALYVGSIRVYDVTTCEVVGQINGLRDPAQDSSMADSPYFALADHDTSSILQWSLNGSLLEVRGYGRMRMLQHSIALEAKSVTNHNRGMTGFLEPSLELPSTNGQYKCLLWGDGGALVWDLTKPDIHYMGLLPVGRPEKVTHDHLLLLGGGKSTWFFSITLGKVIYLNELFQRISVVGNLAVISQSLAMRPGGTDVLFALKNSLVLVDIAKEKIIWQRENMVPVWQLMWNRSGSAFYLISSDGVILQAENDGAELYRWQRWLGSRFLLAKDHDGIVMIGRKWGCDSDNCWDLIVGQQPLEVIDDSYKALTQPDFGVLFPYWRTEN